MASPKMPIFWGRRNYSKRFVTSYIVNSFLETQAPDGYKIYYAKFNKVSYIYVFRKPKQLKVKIK